MIDLILLTIVFCLIGIAIGTFTGLTPGIHINNAAIILLALSPSLAAFLGLWIGLDDWTVLLMVSSIVVAAGMAHTFLDFIPSTLLGAPEAENALSVLPAHQMLLEGRGYTAIYLSAVGSFGAIIVGSLLLIPYKLVINRPVALYELMKDYIVYIMIAIVVLMLVSESAKVPYRRKKGDKGPVWGPGPFSQPLGVALASFQFLLSGILGLIVLDMKVDSPFGLWPSVLFPTLSGLFGISTLLESLRGGATIPPQRIEEQGVEASDVVPSIASGTVAGSVVGFLPGMSGGVATVIAMLFRKEPKPSSVIMTLSAINTANSFFVLAALFLILRPRSGAAIVVDELIDVKEWQSGMPIEFSLLLMSALLASAIGFFLTLYLGRKMVNVMPKLPYSKVAIGIILFIIAMVFAFTGWKGLLILAVSTAIGMIPPLVGIRRSHSMGVLMVPVLFMMW